MLEGVSFPGNHNNTTTNHTVTVFENRRGDLRVVKGQQELIPEHIQYGSGYLTVNQDEFLLLTQGVPADVRRIVDQHRHPERK